jgi:hypothetical protein
MTASKIGAALMIIFREPPPKIKPRFYPRPVASQKKHKLLIRIAAISNRQEVDKESAKKIFS